MAERLEIIITASDLASGAIRRTGGSLRGLGAVAAGVGTAVAAGLAAGITAIGVMTAGLGSLAVQAAPLEDIGIAFDHFAEQVGSSSDEMLAALQDASNGMVSVRDLMIGFNQAVQLAGPQLGEALPEALGLLGNVAASTGQDMDFLMQSLVTGVSRASKPILDNLGIMVDIQGAYEAAAEEMGITVDQMSAAEKQGALLDQVMSQLRENVGDLPDLSDSSATSLAQLQANFQNMKDELGLALLPLLDRALDVIGPGLQQAAAIAVPALTSIVDGIDQFFTLLELGMGPVDALRAVIGEIFAPEVSEQIFEFIDGVELFGQKLRGLAETIAESELAQIVSDLFADVFGPETISNLQTMADDIKNIFTTLGPSIVAALVVVGAGIAIAVGLIITVLSGIGAAFTSLITGDFAGAVAEIEGMINGVAMTFGTSLNQIRADWEFIFSSILLISQNQTEAIMAVFGTIAPRMSAALQAATTSAIGTLMGTVGGFISAGRAMVEGIIAGVRSAAGNLIAYMAQLGIDAIAAVKAILGIASPSRVFMQIGEYMMDGLTLGVSRNAFQPTTAVAGVAQGLVGAGNIGGVGRGKGGITVNFYNNPGISFGVEREAGETLAPVIERVLHDRDLT